MAITFRPIGGLGNQLFTYGAAYALAEKKQVPLIADLHYLKWDKRRNFELDSFRSGISSVRVSKSFMSRPVRGIDLPLLRTYRVKGNVFRPSIFDQPDGITLDGYFQSWRYFSGVDKVLRDQIREVSFPTLEYLTALRRLSTLGSWCAIHVRRGDYLDANFGITSENYYRRGMDAITHLRGQVKFVVFSDDPQGAREMKCFKGQESISFFPADLTLQPIETLNLMASAHAMIIANSTFSWWAAWLGEDKDRPIVHPRPWINNLPLSEQDLFLPDWIGIERD